MLVLSRGAGDGISFPDLDLVVEILKVQGKRVQLGISAADTIRVLRSELCERQKDIEPEAHVALASVEPQSAESIHTLRNELNTLSMGLSIAEKYLQRGDAAMAEKALEDIFGKLAGKRTSSEVPPLKQAAATVPADQSRFGASTCSQSILIVEDNPNEGQLLAEILQLNGFRVATATDGHQAIEWLESNTPHVILMDMHMANCDGPTAVKRIRENPRLATIPIFAVSGADREQIQSEGCGEVAVQDWFQKPVKTQPLLHAIDDLLAQALRS